MMMPYGIIEAGHHWFNVMAYYDTDAITNADLSSVRPYGIHTKGMDFTGNAQDIRTGLIIIDNITLMS